MTVFKGGEAIKEFLEEFDSWLSESVTVYLFGVCHDGSRLNGSDCGFRLRAGCGLRIRVR
ncbi:hypothetical protein ACLI4R_16040 [Natrialbaceae archaeon A-chndr2]